MLSSLRLPLALDYGPPRAARTLVLLHYWAGSGRAWQAVATHAPRTPGLTDVRLVAPDLRGFGGAPRPDAPAWAIADYLADLRALLAELTPARYALVGHSLGGKLAVALAATNPPPGLGAVGLIAPSPPGPEPMTDCQRAVSRAAWGDPQAAEATARHLVDCPLPSAAHACVVADNLATSVGAWRGWLAAGSRENWQLRVAAGLRVPVQLLASHADPVLPVAVQRQHTLPWLPSTTHLTALRRGGHLLPLERPATVRRWLVGVAALL